MKRFFTALLFLYITSSVFAQVSEHGIVNEYNGSSSHKPLGDVELNVFGAGSTASDHTKGTFVLRFNELAPGSNIRVRSILKDGYEVFNKDAIASWRISNDNQTFEIVMCKSSMMKELKDKWNMISSENYKKQYELDKKHIDELLAKGEISQKECEQLKAKLADSYYASLDELTGYIDKFCHIDLSNAQEIDLKVYSLMEQGKMDEAIALYEGQKYIDKLESTAQKREQIIKAEELLSEEIDHLYSRIDQMILAYNMSGSADRFSKIAELKTRIADAVPSNIEWQLDAAYYLRTYLNDFDSSLRYIKRAEDLLLSNGDTDTRAYAMVMSGYSMYYDALGKYDNAIEYDLKNLNVLRSINSSDSLDVCDALQNIGASYIRSHQYDKAEEFLNRAITGYTSVFGTENNVGGLYANNNLSAVYSGRGNYHKAISFLKKTEDIYSHLQSDVEFKLNTLYNNFAVDYLQIDSLSTALYFAEKSLNMGIEDYGESNPKVAISYKTMAQIFYEAGQYNTSIKYAKESAAIFDEAYGGLHHKCAMAYNIMGMGYSEIRDFAQSYECYQKAKNILTTLYGENTPELLSTYSNISSLFYDTEQYDKALEYNDLCISISIANGRDKEPNHITFLQNRASFLSALGRFDDSIRCNIDALAISDDLLGENSSMSLRICNNLGLTYMKLQDYSSAEYYLLRAVRIADYIYSGINPLHITANNNLADVYYDTGRLDKAFEIYCNNLSSCIELYGEDSPYTSGISMYARNCAKMICGNVSYKGAIRKKAQEYIDTHMFTVTVTSEDSPAGRQGMSGTYIALEYAGVSVDEELDFVSVMRQSIIEKNLVVWQDGKIEEYQFSGVIGIQWKCKAVTRKQHNAIISQYKSWRSRR